jgi:hypothetical protein
MAGPYSLPSIKPTTSLRLHRLAAPCVVLLAIPSSEGSFIVQATTQSCDERFMTPLKRGKRATPPAYRTVRTSIATFLFRFG